LKENHKKDWEIMEAWKLRTTHGYEILIGILFMKED
jgi:hypothetical protein